VILPFLLESDPKPLGDEVSIRIPPIDDGKFVNPLTPARGSDSKAPVSADPKAEVKAAEVKSNAVTMPKKSITEAERRVLGQSPAQPAPGAASTPAALPAADTPTSAPASTDTPAPKTDVAIATPPSQAPTTGGYAVQVGAFADAKVADDLVATLKSSGFATYTEVIPTAQGSVQRVRVGPFATRAAADAAVAKLKLAGHDRAMVTNTK
jgi:DedD protein